MCDNLITFIAWTQVLHFAGYGSHCCNPFNSPEWTCNVDQLGWGRPDKQQQISPSRHGVFMRNSPLVQWITLVHWWQFWTAHDNIMILYTLFPRFPKIVVVEMWADIILRILPTLGYHSSKEAHPNHLVIMQHECFCLRLFLGSLTTFVGLGLFGSF